MLKVMIREALGATCLSLAAALAHAQVSVVSVAQTKPGEVSVRVQLDVSETPAPKDFSLQLGADRSVNATTVAPAPSDAASTALVLCIDRSGSIGPTALSAMKAALQESLVPRPGASALPFSIAIIAFSSRSDHVLTFTTDPQLAAAAISRISIDADRAGKTRLYDAIAGGLAQLRASDAAVKRVLLLTDGADEGSHISQEALLAQASSAPAVPLDAIAFGALTDTSAGSLSTLGGATHGKFVLVQNKADLSKEVSKMVRQIASAQSFDVAFRYTPAAGGGAAERPALQFRPKSGEMRQIPLQTAVAAADGTLSPAEPGPKAATQNAAPAPASAPAQPGGVRGMLISLLNSYPMVQKVLLKLPTAGWIVLGVLLLLLVPLALWWKFGRQTQPAPPVPAPPPMSTVTRVPTPPPAPLRTESAPPAPPKPTNARHTVAAYRWPTPGQGRAIAVLKGLSGSYGGRQFVVVQSPTRIGFAADNDLVLGGDDFVSSHHAVIKGEGSSLYLADLGSTNGSLLNGVIVKGATRALSPGDQIQLGQTVLQVMPPDASASGQPRRPESQVP